MFDLVKLILSSMLHKIRCDICARIGHKKGRETNLTQKCKDFYGWHFMCSRCGRFLDKDGTVPTKRS